MNALPPASIAVPPIEYDWPQPAVARLHIPADADGAMAGAAEAIGRLFQKLQAVARKAAPKERKEAARLAAQLHETNRARDRAKALSRDRAARAKQLLGRGENPDDDEKTAAEQQSKAATYEARAEHLAKLLKVAEKRAHEAGVREVEAAWRELIAECGQRRADILQRIADALAPLLIELLSCDRLEMVLYDPQSGRPPADVLALLEAPAEVSQLAG